MSEYMDELQAIWDRAMVQAARNAAAGNENAAQTGGARMQERQTGFARDKYYDRQIDQWDTKPDGARVKVGEVTTGSALNQVGFPASGMWFDVGKIKKGFDKHSDHYSAQILKDIPAVLADPIAITDFKGNSGDIMNTVTVYGLTIPDTGIPVVVGVMMTKGRDGRMIVNKIRTVHADSHADINDNNILYLCEDKKRTRKWFQVCGIKVPLEGTRFGLIRSISFTDSKSKPKLQARDNMPDRRELLLGAAEEDRADTALSAYRKKFLAMEAAQRKLERQREALAAMERDAAEERSFDSLALAQDDRGGALAQDDREGRIATPVTRSLARNDSEGAEQRATARVAPTGENGQRAAEGVGPYRGERRDRGTIETNAKRADPEISSFAFGEALTGRLPPRP